MKNNFFHKITRAKSFTLILVWIAVLIFFRLINPNYLSWQNIKNILYATSLAGTLAVGIGCRLISGGPDLSAGAVGMMGGVIVALLLQAGWSWVPALLAALVFGAFAGSVNAFFKLKFQMMPFISTLAMASVWKGLGYIITGAQSVSIGDPTFQKLGTATLLGIPVPFVITIVLYVIHGIILSRTKLGRRVYMIGGNRTAAELAGINITKMEIILAVNCSTIAALGGAILAGRMHSATAGSVIGTEFDGIIASCLGGISFGGGSGGMFGAFIGLMLLGSFKNGLSCAGLNTYWQIVASGLLLILALVVDFINEQIRVNSLKKKIA